MATKKIILLLLILSLIISGCLSSEDEEEKDREAGGSSGGVHRQREVRTPEGIQGETWTPGEMETEGEAWASTETENQTETVAQEELETPAETETQIEPDTSAGTVTSGISGDPGREQTEAWTGGRAGAVQPGETAPTSHLVRLKNYLMIPSSLEVKGGDTIIWRNYQESSVLTLTSREHLFEDQRLAYGNTLEYTFNELGSYNFSVKGYPKMQTTITVK